MRNLFLMAFALFSFSTFAQSGGIPPADPPGEPCLVVTDFIIICNKPGTFNPDPDYDLTFKTKRYILSVCGNWTHKTYDEIIKEIREYACQNNTFPSGVYIISSEPLFP